MIQLNTNKQLSIILPNTNRALKEVLQNASPKEFETLSKAKDLNSILNSMLKESSQNTAQNKQLLNMLKNSPLFKKLGNVNDNIKILLQKIQSDKTLSVSFTKLTSFLNNSQKIDTNTLKSKFENSGIFLESKIKNFTPPPIELRNKLQELSELLSNTKLQNVQKINVQLKNLLSSKLFEDLQNSDVTRLTNLSKNVNNILTQLQERLSSTLDKSLQSKDVLFSQKSTSLIQKLKILNKPSALSTQTQLDDLFSKDLKSLLFKLDHEVQNSSSSTKQEILKQLNKLILQIDYQQLVSHLSDTSSLYIPYAWDSLEDGNITIQKAKKNKFFADIELTLKKFGELRLRLGMFEKNQLNINITTKSKELKSLIKEALPLLKKALIDVEINPSSIRFLDTDSDFTSAYNTTNSLDIGFEAKA